MVSLLSPAQDVYLRELKLFKLQSILLQLGQMLMAIQRSIRNITSNRIGSIF